MKEATPNFYKVVITLRVKLSKVTTTKENIYSLLLFNIVLDEIGIAVM